MVQRKTLNETQVSVTQQLVDDLVAAGGSLRVPRKRWNDKGGVDYERRARLAESYGKVPPGSRLVVKTASAEELVIELVTDRIVDADGSDPPPALTPLPVPA